MIHARVIVVLLSVLALASAQSVISTHAGLLYFFEGSVFLGDQQLEQKFGKFPEIGEGRELRTEQGRAEVLLTPGVFLRVGDNSAIRMVSNKLSDTQVELLSGSAIVEVSEASSGTAVKLIHKNWQVRVPHTGVFRVDSEPPQIHVYKGETEVSAEGKPEKAIAREGEVLPLAAVLVAEPSPNGGGDTFKTWAMGRSQAISADNATAAEIVDDPSRMDPSGLAFGGFSYFPPTGVPSLGISNPYGVSFWSPYQAALSSMYISPYLYGPLYPGWPSGLRYYPRGLGMPLRIGTGTGLRPGGITPTRGTFTPMPQMAPHPAAPHAAAPHGVARGGHR